MRSRVISQSAFLLLPAWAAGLAADADLQFRHHFVDRTPPVSNAGVGDYGLTALVDLDRDGDLDFVLGGRPSRPSRLYWYEFQAADRWVRHEVGTDYLSDVVLNLLNHPKPAAEGNTGSATAEGISMALDGGAVTVKRVDALPYVESEYMRRFKFDSAENPKLRKLRRRYQLDAVVAAGQDEFDRQVRLLDWVHHRFKKLDRKSVV